ncbi:MAG TPA: carboxylating nicotinate-nucleotide diphosphorylase [Polyangiaceae bacterium]|nr:carboxylating nicotinate-nucleotide diphosphorylase [Polyangiaceae bacterium]
MDWLPARAVDELVDRALHEDLASGDLTSECCVPSRAMARAQAVARHPLVVCGGPLFARVFQRVDGDTRVDLKQPDGAWVEGVLWEVSGRARSLLSAERVALNFVQRLSGIASMARRYVGALAPNSKTRITDTRKTTPGLRLLERYAVRVGGAHNHRDNLGSAVMIKDNHIVAAGSIRAAVESGRARAPHTSRIEVEVTTLAELDEAIAAGADIILLDNMDTPTVKQAVARVASLVPRPMLEASGGITLERVRELSEAGVDVISVGALTHSAPAADIGLDFVLEP